MILIKYIGGKALVDKKQRVNGKYVAYLVDDNLKQLYSKTSGNELKAFVSPEQVKKSRIKR